ncbi:hypothetical protein GGX14DRAFT_675965 [Mycena pura]|uniref:Uncharacterized protein n=1 Tax=Mycena pura TaxID=153505 RepID=A0AAD6VUT4_9AGAR|nr:hypothetical protein GGX14DRAFT_675965 [Mycena pura]
MLLHRLEPFFYRVIFLDDSESSDAIEGIPRFTNAALLRLIDEKRKAVLANARHLIIQDPAQIEGVVPAHLRRLNAIMAACTGVTHLFLHSNKKLESHELEALGGMPALRVLGIHVSKLFRRADRRRVSHATLTHPVFRNITHLEVFDRKDEGPWEQLGDIPNLTHLAFSEMWVCPMLVDAMCLRAPLLDALVFLCRGWDMKAIHVAGRRTEPWFVTMILPSSSQDWQRGGLTGIDYWAAADELIAKRNTGAVPLRWEGRIEHIRQSWHAARDTYGAPVPGSQHARPLTHRTQQCVRTLRTVEPHAAHCQPPAPRLLLPAAAHHPLISRATRRSLHAGRPLRAARRSLAARCAQLVARLPAARANGGLGRRPLAGAAAPALHRRAYRPNLPVLRVPDKAS